MNVGASLLDLAVQHHESSSIAVVGTAKNVGKTVAIRSLCDALAARRVRFGITSIGRDGECADALDSAPKPRLHLRPGAIMATARPLLALGPACEILDLSARYSAVGPIVYAAVRRPADYEIAGPSTAAGMAGAVERLFELGARDVLVDGAVDRLSALAGLGQAIIVSAGAADAATLQEIVDEAQALVALLRMPTADPSQPRLLHEGALTAQHAAALIARGEMRQVIVRDPTRVVVRGRAFLALAQRLRVRCEHPLRVVAVTMASIGRAKYFEPRDLQERLARATRLPVFDVYAGTASGV